MRIRENPCRPVRLAQGRLYRTRLFFPISLGTSVPGFLMPPLRGWIFEGFGSPVSPWGFGSHPRSQCPAGASSSVAAFAIAAATSSRTLATTGTWASASVHFLASMYSRTAAMGLAP